jgi:hypothetical protein
VALGVVRDLRSLDSPGDAAAHQEHLMGEYVLAHGVTDSTIRGEIDPPRSPSCSGSATPLPSATAPKSALSMNHRDETLVADPQRR